MNPEIIVAGDTCHLQRPWIIGKKILCHNARTTRARIDVKDFNEGSHTAYLIVPPPVMIPPLDPPSIGPRLLYTLLNPGLVTEV
jgi:hypothetical protein